MLLRRTVSLVGVFLGLSLVTGCSVETTSSDGGERVDSAHGKLTLSGNVASSSIGRRTFGNVDVTNGHVHVAARRLHERGATSGTGGAVRVLAGADGSFRLDVARGGRYVITVDDADGNSALVTFAGGSSALSVSANGESGVVRIGDLRVEGGEAKSDVTIDGRFGLAATLVLVNEVFEAANGAIVEAHAAVEEARRAADEARKAADLAAEEALRAAEAAKNIDN